MKTSSIVETADTFVLEEWVVSPQAGELRSNDRVVRISPKVMDVLVYLVTNAERVVSRDELISTVWASVAVTDDSLTQAVIKLRRALGDSSEKPRFIETIPKRGYRLIASVESESTCAQHNEKGVIDGAQRFATKQFRARSVFSYGVVGLAMVVGVGVAASAFLPSLKHSASEAGTVDATNGAIAESENRQEEAVAKVAPSQKGSDKSVVEPSSDRGTDNDAAYDSYLFGLSHIRITDRSSGMDPAELAKNAFDRSIELDPDFADAYAGLAWVEYIMAQYSCDEMSNEAWAAIKTSLALRDNSLARRLVSRKYLSLDPSGSFSSRPTDFKAAVSELRRSIELEPGNVDALVDLAHALVYYGSLEPAVTYIDRAKELNPNHTSWYQVPAGIASYLNGDFENAVNELASAYNEDARQLHGYWYVASLAKAGYLDAARHAFGVVIGAWDYSGKPYPGMSTTGSGAPYTIFSIKQAMPLKQAFHMEAFIDGLRTMGVPEMPTPAS